MRVDIGKRPLEEVLADRPEVLMTFEVGILVGEEPVEADNPATQERLQGEAEEGRYQAWIAYEEWVSDAHPERYSSLFEAPCCEVAWTTFPSAVPEHEELKAEYLRLVEPKSVEVIRTGSDSFGEDFAATGAAVDGGLFCRQWRPFERHGGG